MRTPQLAKANIGSLLVSGFFILAAIVTLYDTTNYSDIDSKIFPQTVAIIMIIVATASFISSYLKPAENEGFGKGIWWRRCLLVITMLITCAAMPYIGFLVAGSIAFTGGLIAAMHDQWSLRAVLLYWGSGAVIMSAFYALFKYALYVPLP